MDTHVLKAETGKVQFARLLNTSEGFTQVHFDGKVVKIWLVINRDEGTVRMGAFCNRGNGHRYWLLLPSEAIGMFALLMRLKPAQTAWEALTRIVEDAKSIELEDCKTEKRLKKKLGWS